MALAWALTALAEKPQYAGNRGYTDDLRKVYRYDSNVGNSKRLERGDLVFLRDERFVRGIARVERIFSEPGKKTLLRCPECRITGTKERAHKLPRFRCDDGHVFDTPIEDVIDVTNFEAHFESSFRDLTEVIPISLLKAAAPRPSDMLSIQEIDISKLESRLTEKFPDASDMLAVFFQTSSLDSEDADDANADERAGDGKKMDSFSPSTGDGRKRVLQAIRQRRGQPKFRKALIKRYGASCMVTACGLMDVIEAAHIWPYRGDDDNHPENGLLLRADIHTLFDLDLIAIEPETLLVRCSPPLLLESEYAALSGRPLILRVSARPARGPLDSRWTSFCLKWPLGDQAQSK